MAPTARALPGRSRGDVPVIADVTVLCQPLLSLACVTLLCHSPRRGADVPLPGETKWELL